jgi:hypothetical protein
MHWEVCCKGETAKTTIYMYLKINPGECGKGRADDGGGEEAENAATCSSTVETETEHNIYIYFFIFGSLTL